jgi:O-antigen/teichoic acid export membrane protein
MIASANLVATVLGIVGSLVQARYISPDDLGFVRKYSVISGYAIFLTLGLFTILQREYPVLIGRGEPDKARRVAAIGHSWSLLTSTMVCGGLLIVCIVQLLSGNWRESAAWFIQVVSVWTILYGGYLACTFRSGHEFEKLAKSGYLASIVGVLVLPLFAVWPFATLILRSVAGSLVSSVYQHVVRPVKVGWCLPWDEFFQLVKRGGRLFAGTYIRYQFWLTVEILLLVRYAGDVGVGLFTFSSMIAMSVGQVATAVNQIYTPRLAQHFGQTGSLASCMKMAIKPTLVNVLAAAVFSCAAWLTLPPLLAFAFPKYAAAIPMIKVLLAETLVVGLSLPLYMVAVLEDYRTQIAAAVAGLAVFVVVAYLLHGIGLREMSVVWGTIAGKLTFVAVSIASLVLRMKRPGAVATLAA